MDAEINLRDALMMSLDDHGFNVVECDLKIYHQLDLKSWVDKNKISKNTITISLNYDNVPKLKDSEDRNIVAHIFYSSELYPREYRIETALRSFYRRIVKFDWAKDGSIETDKSRNYNIKVIRIRLKKL
jgi:hypothetical protein